MKGRVEQADEKLDEREQVVDSALILAMNCDRAYRKATTHNRRLLNAAIFKKLEVRDGKIASATFAEPFDLLFRDPGSNKSHMAVPTVQNTNQEVLVSGPTIELKRRGE